MYQLTFKEGSKPGNHKNITIAILPDATVENQESFLISLTSLSSLAEIKEGRNSTTAIILDSTSEFNGLHAPSWYWLSGEFSKIYTSCMSKTLSIQIANTKCTKFMILVNQAHKTVVKGLCITFTFNSHKNCSFTCTNIIMNSYPITNSCCHRF